MMLREKLLSVLPPYAGERELITECQDTYDIIAEILKVHKQFAGDYDLISDYFWKGNDVDTAKYIFDFLKKNVEYSIETGHHQSVKSPAAIIATGIYTDGGNDCKHYAQFTAGILDSLKRKGYDVNWNYRFASYQYLNNDPGHVFVVIKDEDGKDFWIDPVLDRFNERKKYVSAIDKKVNTMALYKISGAPGGDDEQWLTALEAQSVSPALPPDIGVCEFVYRYLISGTKNDPSLIPVVQGRLIQNNMIRSGDMNAKRLSDFGYSNNASIGNLISTATSLIPAGGVASSIVSDVASFVKQHTQQGAESDAWAATHATGVPLTPGQEVTYRNWLATKPAYLDSTTYINVLNRLYATGNLRQADLSAGNAQAVGANGLNSPLLTIPQLIWAKSIIPPGANYNGIPNNAAVNAAISQGVQPQPLVTQTAAPAASVVPVVSIPGQQIMYAPSENDSLLPATAQNTTAAPVTNYLPYIIGGLGLLLLLKD